MKINPEKIRDVIGKGGAVIRALTEETGTQIDIDEDGTITIASTDPAKAEEAKKRIEQITAEVEIGKVYEGPITKLLDFGALVNLLPGKDGLLHISQIAHERVEKVTDYLSEGQIVRVKVLETDEKGRVKLSMKALARASGRQRVPGSPAARAARAARTAWRRAAIARPWRPAAARPARPRAMAPASRASSCVAAARHRGDRQPDAGSRPSPRAGIGTDGLRGGGLVQRP